VIRAQSLKGAVLIAYWLHVRNIRVASHLRVLTGGLPAEQVVADKTLAHVLTHDNECLANLIEADLCWFSIDGGQRFLSARIQDARCSCLSGMFSVPVEAGGSEVFGTPPPDCFSALATLVLEIL
jgi:hypothetical protein